MILLVAAVAAAVFAAAVPQTVGALYEEGICRIEQRGGCDEIGEQGGPDGGETLVEPRMEDPGIPTAPVCEPLCEAVPGHVNLAEWPDPPTHPERRTAQESQLAHDSANVDDISRKTFWTWPWTVLETKKQDAYLVANGGAFRGMWTARRALLHFLDGSGNDFEVDVDEVLEDVPEFREAVADQRQDIGRQAILQAQEDGAEGPVTFPVSSEWNAFGTDPDGGYIYDDSDWINTLGSWNHAETGEVTVFPPEDPGGEWTYEMRSTTHLQKYYDWDRDETGPVLDVGPFDSSFSEMDLSEMHRAGIAQEFWAKGETGATTTGTL
ncbi:hypothetical protein [Nocardiopsis coralliicola]